MSELNGGRPGWNYDEPAVVEAVCELAVRRFFSQVVDVREIAVMAADMPKWSSTFPSPLKIEAVMRAALGETGVVIDDIRPPELMEIRSGIFGYLLVVQKMAYSLDEIIAEAEDLAFERGWHPPPEAPPDAQGSDRRP